MTFPISIANFQIEFEDTEFIRHWEGFSLTAYPDSTGVWTIAWGITGPDVVEGLSITYSKALEIFSTKIEQFCNFVCFKLNNTTLNKLTKEQFIALLSFTFNEGNESFRHSTLREKLNLGDFTSAAKEFIKWKYITIAGKKKISKGLVRRRLSETELFTTGKIVYEFDESTIDQYMN